MEIRQVFYGLSIISLCSIRAGAAPDYHADIVQMLSERQQANPAWVRAQDYPAYSANAPADFFTDPTVLAQQRQAGADLKAAVTAAINAGATNYTVAPGEYRMADNSGWVFDQVEDFTLDGSGARIWFERADPNDIPWRLYVLRSKNVTIKNLQLDFDPPVYIQGTIESISPDKTTIEMQIDPAWPKVSVPEGAFEIYTPDGKYVHQIRRGMHHTGATLHDGDKLTIDVWEDRDLTPNFDADRLAFFGEDYVVEPGYLIALNYRRSHAVTTKYSEKITFEDVDVWQSPGGGFHEDYGLGGNVYRRCRLIRKPGTRRIHMGTADNFHSRGNQNGPQIIECEAGYTSDDIINIYGSWRWLLKQEDATTVLVGSPVPLGDTLTFYNRIEVGYLDEAEVDSIEEVTDPTTLAEVQAIEFPADAVHIIHRNAGEVFRVTLKTPVSIDTNATPEVLIDAHSYNAENLLVKDCYFHDSFSRAQLFGGTVGAVIENNIWDRMNSGIEIYEESWAYEMGPAPQNVTYSNNTVMNMGAGTDAVTVGLVPKIVGPYDLMNTQPSKNIVITDNLFINSSGITMLYVDGGTIQNNTLVEPRGFERYTGELDTTSRFLYGHANYFPAARNSAMSVWSSKNVDVSDNTIYSSGALNGFAPLDIGQWTSNITESGNQILPFGDQIEHFEEAEVEAEPVRPSTPVVSEDFSGGQGAWGFRSDSYCAVVSDALEITVAGSGQPNGAYLDFDDVSLADGETLRLSLDVSVTDSSAHNNYLRFGLGFAHAPISDSTALGVPMDGYVMGLPSAGSTADPSFYWNNYTGTDLVIFNNPWRTPLGSAALDVAASITALPKRAVLDITRSGPDLLLSGSLDGWEFSTAVTAAGVNVISNFQFNTIALGYAFSNSKVATYDNIALEVLGEPSATSLHSLLVNGGFEDATINPWTVANGATAGLTNAARSGSQSAVVGFPDADNAQLKQSIAVTPADCVNTYTLTFSAKVDGYPEQLGIMPTVMESDGVNPAEYHYGDIEWIAAGTTGWRTFTQDFTMTDPDATTFQVLFYYYPQGGPPKVAGSVLMDDISLTGEVIIPPPVLYMGMNGSNLDFVWNSQSGKLYDLESIVSLVDSNWAAHSGHMNITATPPTNTLTGVATDGPVRFFRIIEKE